jgi:nucleoside-diphosphate-sugar epimerase/phosphohistidine swiveling domain-containing protein
MRIAVTGADSVLGRSVATRLVSRGHAVIGLGAGRPESWPGSVEFVATDLRDADAVKRALDGVDVAVHGLDMRVAGLDTVLAALDGTAARVVFVSAGDAEAQRAERTIADSGLTWVAIRTAVVMGRDVDDPVLRRFTAPVLFDFWDSDGGSADHPLQLVHTEDVVRLTVVAALREDPPIGVVGIAATADTTVRDIAKAIGRPLVRAPRRFAPPDTRAVIDTSRLRDEWDYSPAWTAEATVEDFARAARGRVALGSTIAALPWRLARVREIPAVDAASADGVTPVLAGAEGSNGEFDTPIDPRFPAYVATNLSEALPGPFTPSSASVTVRGARAGGVTISERLRPGGAVQREMARRTTGVFGHRLYAAITSAHFMAETVPLIDPSLVITQFFGRTVENLPVFGTERPAQERTGFVKQLRNVGTFGANLVGLSAGATGDTRDFVDDVDALEALAADPAALDDARLRSLILLARDHVVHGWVLASASIMVCAAYGVILRVMSGRDITPAAGPGLVSAQSLSAMHRLVSAAQRDAGVAALLGKPGPYLETLERRAPSFHAVLIRELALMGHRGPGEVEMSSPTYADDPELLLRMVAKAVASPEPDEVQHSPIPLWVRPVAALASRQLRDREIRRDKMVRAIWLLRRLLRDYGARAVAAGQFDDPDDVFFLLVDELDAPPPDVAGVVARRRAEQLRLQGLVPPEAFSGDWHPATPLAAVLTEGDRLYGIGVSGGRVRGRVRIVGPDTIDDLQPGEVLVAKVTDVGYTPAFAYASAVVTDLGGPMSHAAIVAREFGFPCVVNARGATRRLSPGALVEVDGTTGEILVLDLTRDDAARPNVRRNGHA